MSFYSAYASETDYTGPTTKFKEAKGEIKEAHAELKEAYDADLYNKDISVFFINAEFLYWIVNEGAVDYAVKMNHPAWSSTVGTHAVGNYQNAHYDWSPGFRVNFGYFNAPHFWDVFAQYAFVPASGTRHAHAPKKSGEFLVGTYTQPAAGSAASVPLHKAKCHINLDYNVLDLLFTRRFGPNEHLRLGVFGGLTSAIIFQKMKVSYEDILDQHSHIANRWRFEGVGFRAGMKVDWYLNAWDLYLTGLASSGILSGWYKNSSYQKTSADVSGADSSLPIANSRFHDNRLTYTAQFLLGPSWQKRFKSVRTEVHVAYEVNIWTNLQNIYRSSFTPETAAHTTFINDSLVSLQGLTVRLNVDF